MTKWLQNLKIKPRLMIGFSIMQVLLIIIGFYGYYSIKKIRKQQVEIFEVQLPGVKNLLQTDRDLNHVLVAERSMIFASTQSETFTQLLADYEAHLAQAVMHWQAYKESASSPQERDLIRKYEEAFRGWEMVSRKIINGRKEDTREGRRLAIDLSLKQAKEKFEIMVSYLNQLEKINLTMAQKADQEAKSVFSRSTIFLWIVVLAGNIFGIFVTWLFTSMIVKPIGETINMVQDIAQGKGDLTKRLNIKYTDEIGELAGWFDKFLETLQNLIKLVTHNTNNLHLSSKSLRDFSSDMNTGVLQMSEKANGVAAIAKTVSNNVSSISDSALAISNIISNASQNMSKMNKAMNDIAQEAEKSDENVQSASSAAEELNITIKDIAKNAEQARGITLEAVQNASTAHERVDELNFAANEINNIIGVIIEIAEQTKLLALNATIEAVRAGEAGKGFAVVAGEVKDLAKQTNQATENIRSKIEVMQNSTQKTIGEIKNIDTVINSVNVIVESIASSVEEQSVTTQSIAENICDCAKGINQMTEKSKSTSQAISQLDHSIKDAAEQVDGVTQNVTQAADVTRQIAAEISTVNVTADKIKTQSNSVNSSIEKIANMGDEQKELLGKFKIT